MFSSFKLMSPRRFPQLAGILFSFWIVTLATAVHGQSVFTWTGNGRDSLWTNNKNWSPHGVPGSNDTANIDLSGSNLVILDTNLVIGTINLGGQGENILDLSGVTVLCFGSISVSNNGVLQVTGSSVIISGLVQNSGTIMVPANLGTQSLTLMSGFTNSGALDAETNSVLNLVGTNSMVQHFVDGSSFNGAGTVQLSLGGKLDCSGTMTVNGTVTLQQQSKFGFIPASIWSGPGLLRWDSGVISNITFAPNFNVQVSGSDPKSLTGVCTNQGTVHWSGGPTFVNAATNGFFYNSGTFEIEGDSGLVSQFRNFQNTGTIRVPPDLGTVSLTLQCGFTNYGAIDVESNSTFLVEAPVSSAPLYPSFESGTLFEGPGVLRFPTNSLPLVGTLNGPIVCNGTITVDGTVELNVSQFGGAIWTGSGVLRWWGSPLFNPTFASGFHVEITNNDPHTIVGVCTNK